MVMGNVLMARLFRVVVLPASLAAVFPPQLAFLGRLLGFGYWNKEAWGSFGLGRYHSFSFLVKGQRGLSSSGAEKLSQARKMF